MIVLGERFDNCAKDVQYFSLNLQKKIIKKVKAFLIKPVNFHLTCRFDTVI